MGSWAKRFRKNLIVWTRGRSSTMKSRLLRHSFAIVFPLVIGCSSAAEMAAKHEGVSVSDIEDCENRLCFLKLGSEILDKKENGDGTLTEIYRVKRARGSSVRSFTHGVLSIGTLGVWNVVGTPIEGLMSSDEFIVFRVFYDAQEKAKKVELQG